MFIDVPRDPRADAKQMRRYPWREDYFRDFSRAPVGYWPVTVVRNLDYTSEYVNQRDGNRESYEPSRVESKTPVIAFYGGSTMWGEGQRDLFTIPSYIARMAEADSLPVTVVNHGVRGVSSWDEALQFETDVAGGERVDLAVFYDGWNDCSLQAEAPVPGQPWQFLVEGVRERLGADQPDTPDDWTESAWV